MNIKAKKPEKEHNLNMKLPVSLDRVLQELAERKFTSKSAIVRDLIRIEAEKVGL
jgi:hypothetical protein